MGLIHVYCGDGKGKTTCSLGMALRASGAGLNVIIVQFLKGAYTSELKALKKIENIKVIGNTQDFGFINDMTKEQLDIVKTMHNKNLHIALEQVQNGECDMLILDEVTYAYNSNLVDKNIIQSMIEKKPEKLELIITGRNPDKLFTDNADYITEMKCVRHPYKKGCAARKGIEF